MKLICPNCETTYEIRDGAMPAGGRRVRCQRCDHRWHAEVAAPPADEVVPQPASEAPAEPATEAPPRPDAPAETSLPAVADETLRPAPPPVAARDDARLVAAEMIDDAGADEPAAEADEGWPGRPDRPAAPDAAAARAARRLAAGRRARRGGVGRAARLGLIAAMLAMAVFAVQYRDEVVRTLPQAAAIYRTVGMQVNTRGLRFEALAPQRTIEEGVPTLVVEGKILNIRRQETEIPALRFVLRNAGGEELYNWTIEPSQRVLEEGGELTFTTRLASPPANADAVELRFVDRRIKQAGMQP